MFMFTTYIAVATKGKDDAFDGLNMKLFIKEDFTGNDIIGNISSYLGCVFKLDEAKGIVKIIETTFVKSLADEIYVRIETTASVVDGLGPKRLEGRLALQAGSK